MMKKLRDVRAKFIAEFKHLKVIQWVFALLWEGSDKRELRNGLILAILQAVLLMLPPILLVELSNVLFQKYSWFSIMLLKVIPNEAVIMLLALLTPAVWVLAFDFFNRYTYYSRKIVDGTQAKFQLESFGGMLYQDLSFHKQNRAAAIQSQVRDTSKTIYLFLYSDLTIKAIFPIISIPLFAIYIVWINPWLILVSIAPFLYVLYLNFTIAPKIAKAEHKSWNVVGETAEYCLNRLQNYRIVKMFRNEQYEIDTAGESFQEQLAAQLDSNVNWRKLTNRSKRIGAVFMVIFVSYIAFGSHWGWYSAGIIVSAVWYYIKMFDSFIDICFTYNSANRLAPQLSKIEPFLIESKIRQEVQREIEILTFQECMEFRNVHFTHPPKDDGGPTKALEGINCKFYRGQVTVVVGDNGSGKSTMIDLLARMDKPESGQILLDGVDIDEYSDEAVAKLSAAAWQESQMFRATIKHNLMYARPGVTMSEVEYWSQRVGIHEVIMQKPRQYETMLGDVNDPGLSGGQMRRLELVRALLADRQILILDEPTAGLDATGINMIWGLIDEQIASGRTVVMISHRPEDLALANSVIYLAKGLVTKEEHKLVINRN